MNRKACRNTPYFPGGVGGHLDDGGRLYLGQQGPVAPATEPVRGNRVRPRMIPRPATGSSRQDQRVRCSGRAASRDVGYAAAGDGQQRMSVATSASGRVEDEDVVATVGFEHVGELCRVDERSVAGHDMTGFERRDPVEHPLIPQWSP